MRPSEMDIDKQLRILNGTIDIGVDEILQASSKLCRGISPGTHPQSSST
jgi:hypothetical protein